MGLMLILILLEVLLERASVARCRLPALVLFPLPLLGGAAGGAASNMAQSIVANPAKAAALLSGAGLASAAGMGAAAAVAGVGYAEMAKAVLSAMNGCDCE